MRMSDTPPLLEQLEKLQKEATPAPWDYEDGDIFAEFWLMSMPRNQYANPELVVALRNNLPQILQALRVQEAARRYISVDSSDPKYAANNEGWEMDEAFAFKELWDAVQSNQGGG